MFEILAVITGEHGGRVCTTGEGHASELEAIEALKRWQTKYPAEAFFIEWQPAADEWNAY